jgi:hypothetical protein
MSHSGHIDAQVQKGNEQEIFKFEQFKLETEVRSVTTSLSKMIHNIIPILQDMSKLIIALREELAKFKQILLSMTNMKESS